MDAQILLHCFSSSSSKGHQAILAVKVPWQLPAQLDGQAVSAQLKTEQGRTWGAECVALAQNQSKQTDQYKAILSASA